MIKKILLVLVLLVGGFVVIKNFSNQKPDVDTKKILGKVNTQKSNEEENNEKYTTQTHKRWEQLK